MKQSHTALASGHVRRVMSFLSIIAVLPWLIFTSALAVIPNAPGVIYPELLVRGQRGSGPAEMTVSLQSMSVIRQTFAPLGMLGNPAEAQAVWPDCDPYVVFADANLPANGAWSSPRGFIATGGVAVDALYTLVVTGRNLSAYEIVVNLPDESYEVQTAEIAQNPLPLHYPPPTQWISRRKVSSLSAIGSTPETRITAFRVRLKAAAVSPAGKADTLQPGNGSLKISLGTDRAGRPAGYIRSVRGPEPAAHSVGATGVAGMVVPDIVGNSPDISCEYEPYVQFNTTLSRLKRAVSGGLVFVAYYNEPGFLSPDGFVLRCYDEATWGSVPQPDTSKALITYKISSPAIAVNSIVSRTEGGLEMIAEAAAFNLGRINTFVSTGGAVAMDWKRSGSPVTKIRRGVGTQTGLMEYMGQSAAWQQDNTWVGFNNAWPVTARVTLVIGRKIDSRFLGFPMVFRISDTEASSSWVAWEYRHYLPLAQQLEDQGTLIDGNSNASWLKLEWAKEPGGGWSYYTYADEFNKRGMLKTHTRPYKDGLNASGVAVSPSMVADNTVVDIMDYAPDFDGSESLPLTKKSLFVPVGGSLASGLCIRESQFVHNPAGYAPTLNGKKVWTTVKRDYFKPSAVDPNAYLQSAVRRYRRDEPDVFSDLPVSQVSTDGAALAYYYHFLQPTAAGGYQLHPQQNPVPSDGSFRTIVVSGLSGNSGETGCWQLNQVDGQTGDPIWVTPMRSTVDVTIRDRWGRLVASEQWVVGNSSEGILHAKLEGIINTYNAAGDLVVKKREVRSAAGTSIWVPVYEAQFTDRNAAVTVASGISFDNVEVAGTPPSVPAVKYTGRKQEDRLEDGMIRRFHYDDYGRMYKWQEFSAPALDGQLPIIVPGNIKATHEMEYDADGRILTEKVYSGSVETDANATLKQRFTYDLAGRMTSATDEHGVRTVTEYDDVNRLSTIRLYDTNNVQIAAVWKETKRFRDGRTASVSGTSGATVWKDFRIEVVDGIPAEIETTVQGGENGTQRIVVYSDMLGRKFREVTSNPAGVGDLVTGYSFDPGNGRLASVKRGNLSPLKLEYNPYGHVVKAGFRFGVPEAGNLQEASGDRLGTNDIRFGVVSGDVWEISKAHGFALTGSPSSFPVSETRVRRSGFGLQSVQIPPAAGGVAGVSRTMLLEAETVEIDQTGNHLRTESFREPGIYSGGESRNRLRVDRVSSSTRTANSIRVWHDGRLVRQTDGTGVTVEHGHDFLDRAVLTRDRTGDSLVNFAPGTHLAVAMRTADNSWTLRKYDSLGRLTKLIGFPNYSGTTGPPIPDAATEATLPVVRMSYNTRGQMDRIWGSAAYPTEYKYYEAAEQPELVGALREIRTFNEVSSVDWNQANWPASTGLPNVRRRAYFPENGLLREDRIIPREAGISEKVTTYEYNLYRQMAKRTWPDGRITTYSYQDGSIGSPNPASGNLWKIAYSDSTTPTLTYVYDRLDRVVAIGDALGVRQLQYRSADQQFDREILSASATATSTPGSHYAEAWRVGPTYDSLGRQNGYSVSDSSDRRLHRVSYGYDRVDGRIDSVASSLGTVSYRYHADSGLLESVAAPLGDGRSLVQGRTFGINNDLVRVWETSVDGESRSRQEQRYDQLHRLIKEARTGTLWQGYYPGQRLDNEYTLRSELSWFRPSFTASVDGDPGASVPGLVRRYQHDSAGNRVATDSQGTVWPGLVYVPNSLGQYASRQNPGSVAVSALVDQNVVVSSSSVTLAGSSATPSVPQVTSTLPPAPASGYPWGLKHLFATRERPTGNVAKTSREAVVVSGMGGPSGNIPFSETRYVHAKPVSEAFEYDENGNLTKDAQWEYLYDGENRLRQMATRASGPSSPVDASVLRQRLTFTYDYLGRRTRKQVETRPNDAASWTVSEDRRWIYSGWTPVTELVAGAGSHTVDKLLVWGVALGGGGTGGFVGFENLAQPRGSYLAVNDSRGNVIGLVDRLNGRSVAEYEYGPYGEKVKSTGPLSAVNRIQFSSKAFDAESELLNFGYRYYSPSLGRFLNRDPVSEPGRTVPVQPLAVGGVPEWSLQGGLPDAPSERAANRPYAAVQNASKPHLSEGHGRGFRNSADVFSLFGDTKGYASVGSGEAASGGGGTGGGHAGGAAALSYAYLNNNPFGGIDPLGLDGIPWTASKNAFFHNIGELQNEIAGSMLGSLREIHNEIYQQHRLYEMSTRRLTPEEQDARIYHSLPLINIAVFGIEGFFGIEVGTGRHQDPLVGYGNMAWAIAENVAMAGVGRAVGAAVRAETMVAGTSVNAVEGISSAVGQFAEREGMRARVMANIDASKAASGTSGFLKHVASESAADSGVWALGPGPRGLAIESQLGGNLPAGFRVIDRFENGVATSIKSIDLNAATYQNAQALGSRLNGYVDSLAGWTGQTTPYGGVVIQPGQVTARTLQVAVPQGSMSAAQQAVFNAAAQRAQGAGLNFIVTPVP